MCLCHCMSSVMQPPTRPLFLARAWCSPISMLRGRLGHVPRGSDDENVTFLTFIRPHWAAMCSGPVCDETEGPIKASGCRMGETRSEVGRSASRGAGSKFFNNLIMIDRWYDFMTHYWPASHLLLSITGLRFPPRQDELGEMRHRLSPCTYNLPVYSGGTGRIQK